MLLLGACEQTANSRGAVINIIPACILAVCDTTVNMDLDEKLEGGQVREKTITSKRTDPRVRLDGPGAGKKDR